MDACTIPSVLAIVLRMLWFYLFNAESCKQIKCVIHKVGVYDFPFTINLCYSFYCTIVLRKSISVCIMKDRIFSKGIKLEFSVSLQFNITRVFVFDRVG